MARRKPVLLHGTRPLRKKLDRGDLNRMLVYFKQGKSTEDIARLMRIGVSTVYQQLRSLRPTDAYAEAIIKRAMGLVAEALVATPEANTPEQNMEILHRGGALKKPEPAPAQTGSSMTVVVGMPGKPAMIPPSQDVIDAEETRILELRAPKAIEATTVSVKAEVPDGPA